MGATREHQTTKKYNLHLEENSSLCSPLQSKHCIAIQKRKKRKEEEKIRIDPITSTIIIVTDVFVPRLINLLVAPLKMLKCSNAAIFISLHFKAN